MVVGILLVRLMSTLGCGECGLENADLMWHLPLSTYTLDLQLCPLGKPAHQKTLQLIFIMSLVPLKNPPHKMVAFVMVPARNNHKESESGVLSLTGLCFLSLSFFICTMEPLPLQAYCKVAGKDVHRHAARQVVSCAMVAGLGGGELELAFISMLFTRTSTLGVFLI
jgi:hypothetical protein